MSRRNLKKIQSLDSKRAPAVAEEDAESPQHFVVKKNTFTFGDSDDSPHSDIEETKAEEPQRPAAAAPRSQRPQEETKRSSQDFTEILRDFGVEDTQNQEVAVQRYESVLKKIAKHFNAEWEIAKKFRTAAVQSRAHTTRTVRRTVLTPTALNWPASLECTLEMELVRAG